MARYAPPLYGSGYHGKAVALQERAGNLASSSGVLVRLLGRIEAAVLLTAFVGVCVAAQARGTGDTGPRAVKSESGPWSAGAGFTFQGKSDKIRRSVSAMACPMPADEPASRTCLVVFDEGTEARFANVRQDGFAPLDERVALRPKGAGELDAEGAALDGDFFYVTGSHSPKRGDCSSNPESRRVIRFRRDPETGRAVRNPDGTLADRADTDRLWALMASLPELAPFTGEGKCLGTEPPPKAPHLKGQRAVDIEGLAAKDGRLFFGLRGPVVGSRALVLEVDAAGLFDGGSAQARVLSLDLSHGRAIRDLQAVRDGFLVLTGPGDDPKDRKVGWGIAFWDGRVGSDGRAQPKLLADLELAGMVRGTCDEEVKPEALAVLEQKPASFRVLILSDGLCDGGPTSFRITR